MNYQLSIVGGPDRSGRTFPVRPGKSLVIGRGRDSHTQIQDPRVSRVHCHLQWEGQQVVLVAATRSSETLVNGRPIERCPLVPGVVIQIGDSLLRLDAPELDQPTLAPVRPRSAPQLADSIKPLGSLVGQSLDRFTLVKSLATTTSGMLYEARDTKSNQTVAVKVLAPDLLAQDEQKKRFIRAMKASLPLRNDNLVRILNAGRTGPYCWTAMQFVDGENLQQLSRRLGVGNRLEWRDVWRVAYDVGKALQFLFEKGILHRNVTPSNILRRKSDGVYLLGDLVFAKAAEMSSHDPITQTGRILGELTYLAPERTYASASSDIRADLYSLGATLYFLLAGRPPFVADSLRELMRLVRDHSPQPPREFGLSANSDFSDLVLALLAKRADDRPSVPSVFLLELDRIGRLANLRP